MSATSNIPLDLKAGAAESRPTVVVYTHSLLDPSMTFILSHAEALRRYRPVFAGAHRANGLPLPEGRVFTANRGGITGKGEEFLFRRFGVANRLAADLQKFQPRIVHAHFGSSGPSALALAEALGVPLVVSFHGQDATITDNEARKSWRGREYLRGRVDLIRRAGLIIAVSDFIRAKLLAKGYPAHKVLTFRNGIDTNFFRRGGPQRDRVVLFVGRFVEKKGCEYLLRALGKLSAEGRPVRALLIGDGPLRPALERLARAAGVDAEFAGFLSLDKVRDQLGRATVVAVPSVTAANGDSEGLPTVILEAQAMGTPVVATRHSGIPEAVIENRTGLLVDERDATGLANAVRFFLEHPKAVESFGAAGRAFVESHFDIATQARGLEELYDRVVLEARARLQSETS